MAAAEPSFSTSMEAISCGSTLFRLPPNTPSITISGSVLAPIVDRPLRRMLKPPLGSDPGRLMVQSMQHTYAKLATEIHSAELMTYNACRMKEKQVSFVKEASMAKFYASNVAERTASKCIEMLGGVGFTRDLLVEKFYRDCKVIMIYPIIFSVLCNRN